MIRLIVVIIRQVKEWAGLALPCPVLFKVHGTLGTEIESSGGAAKLSSRSKNFELTGEDGQHLSCTFLEIDREVPSVRKGERVVIMGKAKKDGSLQVKLSVGPCPMICCQLLCNLCSLQLLGLLQPTV